MKKPDIEKLAGDAAWYPNSAELARLVIDEIAKVVPDSLIPAEHARIAECVFTTMCYADIRGLFSVVDEHEWAFLATIAKSIREDEEGL